MLEGAAFTVAEGHRAALVGRNGAGKSTLLRLIAGEIECDSRGRGTAARRPPRPCRADRAVGARERRRIRSRRRPRARTSARRGGRRRGGGAPRRYSCAPRRNRRPLRAGARRDDPSRPRVRLPRPGGAARLAVREAGGCAPPSPPRSSPNPTCCFSTNPPTISTSKRTSGSPPFSRDGRAPCFSAAMTAH